MSKDNSKAGKWAGPDVINGALHVGEGYRHAGSSTADTMRADREQWYPGDSEAGEDGIWGDARLGEFDLSKVYRVPVERKARHGNQYIAFAVGYRKAGPEDCWRADRQEIVFTDDFGSFKWIPATPGENNPSAIYQVPVERKDEPGVFGDSQGEAGGAPPVGEFEDCGREGGPDWQPGECDAVEPDMVNHPGHYNAGPIECIDAIRAALTKEEFRGFCKGSTIKYVWRERGKGGDEDLMKGGWYLVAATGEPTAAEAKLLGVIRELHDFAEPTRRSEYADRARQAFRDAAILLGENGF